VRAQVHLNPSFRLHDQACTLLLQRHSGSNLVMCMHAPACSLHGTLC